MNKKVMNKALFIDFFLRLKLPGIIFTVICILVSLIDPINKFMLMQQSATSNTPMTFDVAISNITPALFVFVFLGVIVLSYMGFSFLNKRKSSDFYHSLPNTRTCTYISVALAVLSWVYITIILTVLVTSLTYFALGIPINSVFPIYLILSFSSCATLVASACFLAMSITGTIFTNAIVAGLILFLPRFVTFVFKVSVLSIAVNSTGNELGPIFNYNYNLPFTFIVNALGINRLSGYNMSFNKLLTFSGGMIYTFILALIYLTLACFLFHKRKSELAENSAPNKLLQHIYRMSITLPVLLLFIGFASSYFNDFSSFFTNNGGTMFFIFAISLIVYFAYEIITTRKPKNLIKAIPLYFALLVVTVGLGFGAKIVGGKIMNTAPTANEIQSINVVTESRHFTSTEYLTIKTKDIQFEDKEIIDLISTALQENIDNYKATNIYGYPNSDVIDGYYSLNLKNGKKIVKQINLKQDDFYKLHTLKAQSSEFGNKCREFPTEKEISNLYLHDLSKEQAKLVWDSFVQEAKTLNNLELSMITQSNQPFYAKQNHSDAEPLDTKKIVPIVYISISGSIGIDNYNAHYDITNLTPKTAALYISIVNTKSKDDIVTEINKIANLDTQKPEEFNYSIAIFDYDNGEKYYNGLTFYGNSHVNTSNDPNTIPYEKSKQLFGMIRNSKLQDAELGKPFIQLSVRSTKLYANYYLALSESDMEKVMDLYVQNITK